MSDIETTFRRRLREERRRAGLTQTDLAQALAARLGRPFDATAVTRMETGPRNLRLDEAVAAVEELGLPLGALLSDQDSIADEIGELERDLALTETQLVEAKADVERGIAAAESLRRRIRDLEAARRLHQDAEEG